MSELKSLFCCVKVPAMPEVGQALVKNLNDPEATAAQVQALIVKDPALTITLLRIANSAMFGFSHTVPSIDKVISLHPFLPRCVDLGRVGVLALQRGDDLRTVVVRENQAGHAASLAVRSDVAPGQAADCRERTRAAGSHWSPACAPGECWQREKHLLGLSACHSGGTQGRHLDGQRHRPRQPNGGPVASGRAVAEVPSDTSPGRVEVLWVLPSALLPMLSLKAHALLDQPPDPAQFMELAQTL